MGVAVPGVAASGGEGDIVHAHIDRTYLVGVEKLGEPYGAGEIGAGSIRAAGKDFRICHDARLVRAGGVRNMIQGNCCKLSP